MFGIRFNVIYLAFTSGFMLDCFNVYIIIIIIVIVFIIIIVVKPSTGIFV